MPRSKAATSTPLQRVKCPLAGSSWRQQSSQCIYPSQRLPPGWVMLYVCAADKRLQEFDSPTSAAKRARFISQARPVALLMPYYAHLHKL